MNTFYWDWIRSDCKTLVNKSRCIVHLSFTVCYQVFGTITSKLCDVKSLLVHSDCLKMLLTGMSRCLANVLDTMMLYFLAFKEYVHTSSLLLINLYLEPFDRFVNTSLHAAIDWWRCLWDDVNKYEKVLLTFKID